MKVLNRFLLGFVLIGFIVLACINVPLIIITWIPFGVKCVKWWNEKVLDPISGWLAEID